MFSMGMCSNRTSLLHSILYLTQTNIFQIKIETKQTNKRKHKKTCSFLCLVCPGYKFCVSDLKMKINPLKKKKNRKLFHLLPSKLLQYLIQILKTLREEHCQITYWCRVEGDLIASQSFQMFNQFIFYLFFLFLTSR